MSADGTEAPADSLQKQVERDWHGRFVKGQSGNPAGREPGSRNRATLMAERMFDGEAEALARMAIERALGGDAAALKICLDRVLAPRRDRAVDLALAPIEGVADIGPTMIAILSAAAEGRVTPGEAGELAKAVATALQAIEASEFERRLQAVEAVQAHGTRA